MNKQHMDIKEKTKNDNCFSTIKLIAAFLVIISHAFSISLGEQKSDFIYDLTNKQANLGKIAVCIFFIIGGYFITKSLFTSKNISEYLRKRLKKIFPPLIITMFITTFIISPFFYNAGLLEFFKSKYPYIYFLKNSLLVTTHQIPGVFMNNVYASSINGSLWTLPLEFLCYIAIIFAFLFKLLDKKNVKYTYALIILLTLFQKIIGDYFTVLQTALPLGLLFLSGSVYYVNREKINYNTKTAIVFSLLLITSFFFNTYIYTKVFLLPYVILYMGFKLHKYLKLPSWLEGISYEIYLYAFFVQQLICYIFGGHMNPYINIVISIPLVVLISYVSNKLMNSILKRIKV